MKLLPKRIRVFPNPWGINPKLLDAKGSDGKPLLIAEATMDAEGRPCGVIHADTTGDNAAPGRMIGARVDPKNTRTMLEAPAGAAHKSRQSTAWLFLGVSNHETEPGSFPTGLAKAEPVSLRPTGRYLAKIREGSLLPADSETARAAGVKFQEPKELFPKLHEAAVAVFNRHFDDSGNVYESFVKERSEKPAEKPEPAPASAVTTESAQSARAPGKSAA